VRALAVALEFHAHCISNAAPSQMHVAYVVMCTGLHVVPSYPSIPGAEHVGASSTTSDKTRTFHSVDYKRREQLTGRKVMILGTGETGMDLVCLLLASHSSALPFLQAYESAKAGAKEVVLCSRAGCVPLLYSL
jgi:dimethylaniline monooxygenase (N-oxide forming)